MEADARMGSVDSVDRKGTGKQGCSRGSTRGFSMLELMIVAVIGLVITTVGLPNMLTVIANTRIRGSIGTLSGIFQNSRMMAVRSNRVMTARFTNTGDNIIAYTKLATAASGLTSADTQVELEAPIIFFTTPSGAGAPSALTSTETGFTPVSGNTSFNSRGLPCLYSGGVCTNGGFTYYFKDTRRTGNNSWAAVSISPAGRIKKWFWNGTAWGD